MIESEFDDSELWFEEGYWAKEFGNPSRPEREWTEPQIGGWMGRNGDFVFPSSPLLVNLGNLQVNQSDIEES